MGDEHAAPAGKGRVPHILAPAPNIGWFKQMPNCDGDTTCDNVCSQ